jgi:bifunctional DNase/RNase
MQIEMTIKGLMVDPITNMPIIILRDKDGQRVLPIWVGVFEANAIALQIENVTTPRPMTHDLLRNVIHDLRAEIRKIVVSDLKENTFYALIHLEVNGEPLAVDARPSDAIALAPNGCRSGSRAWTLRRWENTRCRSAGWRRQRCRHCRHVPGSARRCSCPDSTPKLPDAPFSPVFANAGNVGSVGHTMTAACDQIPRPDDRSYRQPEGGRG